MSTFGEVFRVTTFGESHGIAVGATVDGCPPGIELDEGVIQPILDRRRPGRSRLSTDRNEEDRCQILSGVCPRRKITLGTPINVIVKNKDQRTFDYANVDLAPRPGHAEFTYQTKYGVRAESGGGRSSARETIGRCIGGAIAEHAIREGFGLPTFTVLTYVSEVGKCKVPDEEAENIYNKFIATDTSLTYNPTLDASTIEAMGTLWCRFHQETGALLEAYSEWAQKKLIPTNESSDLFIPVEVCVEDCDYISEDGFEKVFTNCPDLVTAFQMADCISKARNKHDTVGGVTTTIVRGVPAGLGEPVFDKFEARLASAMMSLPATKAFALGEGFEASRSFTGSTHNDCFKKEGSTLGLMTNHCGGTLGGITSGSPIHFKVAFKPVSSIGLIQGTAGWDGFDRMLGVKGRHDPCVLPRCPPLVDAMTSMVCADMIGLQKSRGTQS